ncbi:MAG: hypothetical protein ACREN8_04530 [Candidatus Dormibacteraceae bacterium]
MNQAQSSIWLLVVFLLALGVGVWQFLSPWFISFDESWSPAVWSSIWSAGIVIGISALAAILLTALAICDALQAQDRNDVRARFTSTER